MLAKVVGAAYLIWLGVKTFRSGNLALDNAPHRVATATTLRSFYFNGFLVGASNPKALLFFAAFFPQFLNPAHPMVPQFALLALTFVTLEFSVLVLCALGVSRLVPLLRTPGPVSLINKVCGSLFTVMGGVLLLARRQA